MTNAWLKTDSEHGHHFTHDDFREEVEAPVWGQVAEGQSVVGADGHRLGTITNKDAHVITVEVPHSLLETEELYAPHFAITGVDGDGVRLKWSRDQVLDAHEHFVRYHRGA
jgi:hypothetical protein